MTWVQILGEAVCILFYTNTFVKGLGLFSLPAMSKYQGSLGSFALVWQEKENSEFKPVLLSLKTDLESHPAHDKGFG